VNAAEPPAAIGRMRKALGDRGRDPSGEPDRLPGIVAVFRAAVS
jgi:hypothetical protein